MFPVFIGTNPALLSIYIELIEIIHNYCIWGEDIQWLSISVSKIIRYFSPKQISVFGR